MWGSETSATWSERVNCLQMDCDVDSEMKPFLGDPSIILFSEHTDILRILCERFTISGFQEPLSS